MQGLERVYALGIQTCPKYDGRLHIPAAWILHLTRMAPTCRYHQVRGLFFPSADGDLTVSLISELKRRNVLRVGSAYIVVAWLLVQVAETLFPLFGFDDTPARIVVIILAIGFVPALILSWVFEFTPEGLKRDKDLDHSKPASPNVARRLDRSIVIILVLAVGYFAFDKFVLTPQRKAIEAEQVAQQVERARQEARDEALLESVGDQSIAVLAFDDMSQEQDQEYLSDGIAEEVLNLLAQIPDLRVISRTSAFAFKGQQAPITEVAARLNVANVLEGSVRKIGDRVRITAQLIDASTDTHLWSETYDMTLDDIFAIQDEIAKAVVDALQITLLGEAPASRVVNTKALELTLRGRYLANRRNEGDLQSAFELFEQAVSIDPNVADAWVGLSPLYVWLFDPPRINDAESAVVRAIELEPQNPEAWVRRGMIAHQKGTREVAWEYMHKALEIGPDNQLALAVNASYREHSGDIDGAIELLSRAVAVDPLHMVNQQYLIGLLTTAGRYQDAAEALAHARKLAPDTQSLRIVEARLQLLQGNPELALESIAELSDSGPDASTPNDQRLPIAAMAHHDLGNEAASIEYLEKLQARAGPTVLMDLAQVYAWRGETDLAFQTIDEFRRMPMFEWMKGNLLSPEFITLHQDPRWPVLMRQVGFVN